MKALVTVCLFSLLALSLGACGRGEILQVTPRPTRVADAQPPAVLPTPDAETEAAADAVVVEERQPTGDADAGRVVFNTSYTTNAGVWMCNQCHSISPDEARLIGPGLWNVAVRAGSTVAGQDTYTYIEHAILYPNEHIVEANPPYPQGLMPGNYADLLSDDLTNLIAYLYTLQ